ncbi:hypothetical protein BX616_004326 [Lobosporangium transversale]|uniref:F-box domain-containing protein n=1 Tax=Lobosporangium transversale TaxID=64571 RepID=A0A1Y2H0J0_9FUNG|nr:hypothetical protein BCR41DRAFT_346461 [Lobosporangium transversale]KAF9898222.1 hypothetical protein BX616_004326 [Lobosporangium transversale]ORZ28058.1 hypothetical protein BCR41DRAFT_346461 [Lobosporangium transversale]|eukprot:XP_021885761.1 hypothetical protein BCR41DRAFT_346461 [Lobosporangium transversale]
MEAQEVQNPFLIPNIVKTLGRHVSRSQLLVFLRVCRTWHIALEPLVWHTLALQNQPCNFTPKQATPTLLLRNRHHIRHFHQVGSNSLLEPLAFSTRQPLMLLTSISVSILSPEILMITQHNIETLTSFSCRSNRMRKDQEAQDLWCRHLFHILGMAPHLAELALGPVTLLDPPKNLFNKVCKTVKRLELDRIKVTDRSLYSDSVDPEDISMSTFVSLEALILIWNDFPPQCQLELVRKAPKLKSINWRRGTKLLTESWLSGSLAVPVSLNRLDIGNSHIEDADMARVIAMLPTLEALGARSTPFGTQSALQLIADQRDKMLELDLMDCKDLGSKMIQRMLASMPRLKIFRAANVEAIDIARSFYATKTGAILTSWACLSIEELELVIADLCHSQNAWHEEMQSLVFQQLSMLGRIRVLALRASPVLSAEDNHLLELTLESGLRWLASLKRLYELDLGNMPIRMSSEEVMWMVKECPQLRTLSGNVISAVRKSSQLKQELKILRPEIKIVE